MQRADLFKLSVALKFVYRRIYRSVFVFKTGVYISKYSDCLDLKRWYDGKTGYIVLLKLTKVKIK